MRPQSLNYAMSVTLSALYIWNEQMNDADIPITL